MSEITFFTKRTAKLILVSITVFMPGFIRADSGSEILDAAGIRGGFVVHLGCGRGELTAELHASDSYTVHGLDSDRKNVASARKYITGLGLYGKVSADLLPGNELPYVDNLVNLVVAEDPALVPETEILRVLCPGGTAWIDRNGRWKKIVKKRPPEIDEWTHYLHDETNNAVSADSVVAPPRHLQWVGSPQWARHHDHMASMSALVSSGGRIFYYFDEAPASSIEFPSRWSLLARDAFNGTILWKRRMGTWHTRLWPLKSGPAQLPRRLVAEGDTVYATLALDAPVTAHAAATGETLRTYVSTRGAEEIILSDGVLFTVVDPEKSPMGIEGSHATLNDIRRESRLKPWGEKTREILAVDAETGRDLWRMKSRVLPLTLTVSKSTPRVFFHDGDRVVCLDRDSGKGIWRSEPIPRREFIRSFFAPTLVIKDGVVLFSGGSVTSKSKQKDSGGGTNSLIALAEDSGKRLWSAEHPPSGYKSPEDVFVINGLVWSGATTGSGMSGLMTGRDLRTGKTVKEFPPDVETYWFHHRCYRGRATERFIMTSRTGVEFIDPDAEHWSINHWVRGGCLYGVMPANGLLYAPPHACACYLESKLSGFNALAPARKEDKADWATGGSERLERGSAYGSLPAEVSGLSSYAPEDWPVFRHDAARSGKTDTLVSADLKPAWTTEIGGKLSSPVAADGKLLVASVDTHTVHALDTASGKRLWSFTAGGRVDSPPSVWHRRAYFGCADGWVYCLNAADGKLVWRVLAAPMDRRLMAFEQLESTWPVHGSVLIHDGVVHCVAGRSMFLDGGLRYLKIDAVTGRIISEKVHGERDLKTGRNLQADTKWLNMPAALPDILSLDGERIYMRSQEFDLDGNRGPGGPYSSDPIREAAVQAGEERHLFCPTGFLDEAWFHRSYWMYGKTFCSGWKGYYRSGKVTPSGRILAIGDSRVYGFGRRPEFYRWTTSLEYQLFSAPKAVAEELNELPGEDREMAAILMPSGSVPDPTESALTIEAWIHSEDKSGTILTFGGGEQGYALYLKDGRPKFSVRADGECYSVTGKSRVLSRWVHLAGVLRPDGDMRIYVNGKAEGPAKGASLIPSKPSQGMGIGGDDGSAAGEYDSPFLFTGRIDEVAVHHRALSDSELSEHASAEGSVAYKAPAPELRFSFNHGNAADDSGAGIDPVVPGNVKPADGKFGKAMRFPADPGKKLGGYLVRHDWTRSVPMLVKAMVLAENILFISGPPDVLDEKEALASLGDKVTRTKLKRQSEAWDGKQGALLWAVNAGDGKKLSEFGLDSMPIFDGMIAANGKLYISASDGTVRCLSSR